MIEQPADIRVMQSFRRWRVSICRRNFWVSHKSTHQRLQMRILERANKLAQRPPKLVDISACLRQIIGELNLRIAQLTQLVNGELKTVLILVDQAFDF